MELQEYIWIVKRRIKAIAISSSLVFLSYLIIVSMKPPTYLAKSTVVINQPAIEQAIVSHLIPTPTIPDVFPQGQFRLINLINRDVLLKKVQTALMEKGKRLTLEELEKITTIKQKGDGIFHIYAKTTDKQLPILVANVYAEVSVEETQALSLSHYKSAISHIKAQLDSYRDKLLMTENKIKEFNKKYGVIRLDTELLAKINRVSEYQMEKERILLEKLQIDKREEILRDRLSIGDETFVRKEIIPNPVLTYYKTQLSQLEMELFDLMETHHPEHPKVKAMRWKIDQLKKRIKTQVAKYVEVERQEVNPEYTNLRQLLLTQELNKIRLDIREKVLENIINKEKAEIEKLSGKELEYARLLRDKETHDRLYSNLQHMLEEISILEIVKSGNAQIIEKAEYAKKLKKFNLQMIGFMSLVSLVFGVGFGMILEVLDNTMKTPYHVRKYLKMLVLGAVPKVERPSDRIILNLPSKSVVSEVFNKIIFHFQQLTLESSSKTFVVTSATDDEGKTTVVANLAIALWTTGEKVIMVDSNLRKPFLHRVFEVPNTYGLTSLLTGELVAHEKLLRREKEKMVASSFEELTLNCLQNIKNERLQILTSGPLPSNPIGLLTKEEFGKIIHILRDRADRVIFDTPPLLTVIDTGVVISKVDAVILVIDSTSLKRQEAIRARQILLNLNTKIVGVILTRFSAEEDYYYYYYARKYGINQRKQHVSNSKIRKSYRFTDGRRKEARMV